MTRLLERLRRTARRGSKPRCHGITHGTAEEVAARLTNLISGFGSVRPNDRWMPQGFEDMDEAQLHSAARLLPRETRDNLLSWWLAVASGTTRTPNWDIASTCEIGGKDGLLLVEAKAHDNELVKEETGRKNIKPPVSIAARRNHSRIGSCIQDASLALTGESKLPWALSRDWNYQMSNRFAWSWKLAEMGVPVVLVYLGFLRADEMKDKGKPFAEASNWDTLVRLHSEPLFPAGVWNREWSIHGQTFVPLIRSVEWELEPKVES
jgi:hypothetical protein